MSFAFRRWEIIEGDRHSCPECLRGFKVGDNAVLIGVGQKVRVAHLNCLLNILENQFNFEVKLEGR